MEFDIDKITNAQMAGAVGIVAAVGAGLLCIGAALVLVVVEVVRSVSP